MRRMSKAEHKLAIRRQAKEKVRPSGGTAGQRREYGDEVQKGLSNLRTVSSEGGDSRAKKVKNELLYLINNYQPRYDFRIQQLIDQWRRSGDPEYDPSIKVKLLHARRDHCKNSNAF